MNAKWKLLCVGAAVVLGLCLATQGWSQIFPAGGINIIWDPDCSRLTVSDLPEGTTAVEIQSAGGNFVPPPPGVIAPSFDELTATSLIKIDTAGFTSLDCGPIYDYPQSGMDTDLTVYLNGESEPATVHFDAVISLYSEVSIYLNPHTGGFTVEAMEAMTSLTITSASGSFASPPGGWSETLPDGTEVGGNEDTISAFAGEVGIFIGHLMGGRFPGDVMSGHFFGDDVSVSATLQSGWTVNHYELVVLPYPAEMIEYLQYLVEDTAWVNLANGIENSLDAKLDAALNALDDINTANDFAACNSLNAFINHVETQRGNKITDEDADYLVSWAQEILVILGCP